MRTRAIAILATALILAFFHVRSGAQDEEGWLVMSGSGDASDDPGALHAPAPTLTGPQLAGTDPVGNDADFITPEIQSLAEGLLKDPKLIYDYVHNRIRYSHYFGAKKGAHLTMLEGSGNDFDQCALLVALLRAAGYKAVYQFGVRELKYSDSNGGIDVQSFLRLTASDPKEKLNPQVFSSPKFLPTLFSRCAFPKIGSNGDMVTFGNNNECRWLRVWVRVIADSQGQAVSFFLDPALKKSVKSNALNLSSATGLTKQSILDVSEASAQADHPDYSKDLKEGPLRNLLANATQNLVNRIENPQGIEKANPTFEDLVGGWSIQETETISLNTTPFDTITTWNGQVLPVQQWTEIPTIYFDQVRIVVGNLDKTYFLPALRGRRLALNFSNNSQAQLWIDDGALNGSSGTPDGNETGGTGTYVTATINYDFKLGHWDFTSQAFVDEKVFERSPQQAYSRSGVYAFVYSFEPSQSMLTARQRKLDQYKAAGTGDSDWRVRTETLNVMGLTWMLQTEMAARAIAQLQGVIAVPLARFGRSAQEASFYVDIFMQTTGAINGAGLNPSAEQTKSVTYGVYNHFWSAMESGVLEQIQTASPDSASSIKVIQRCNSSGDKIFRATSANYASTIIPQLKMYPADTNGWPSGSYPDPNPTKFPAGQLLLIPEKGRYEFGSAQHGFLGYITQQVPSAGNTYNDGVNFLISGSNHGGYGSVDAFADSSPILNTIRNAPTYYDPIPVMTPAVRGGDPVNLSSGAFTLAFGDLSAGQQEPRGYTFTRQYSSAAITRNDSLLGAGWSHNYMMKATEASDFQAGLGGSIAHHMAAFLTAAQAALLTYNLNGTAAEWVTTALICQWGVDQIKNNAVNITMGGDSIQFIKQPYKAAGGADVYSAGAGLSHTLTKNSSGNYVMSERHGRSFTFNADKKIATITDPYGKTMSFTYEGNGSARVKTVTDCWGVNGRTLTFNYNAAGDRLDSIKDNAFDDVLGAATPRTVSFTYSGTSPNLRMDSVTDVEGKVSKYQYNGATELRISKVLEAVPNAGIVGRIAIENDYDSFGRVSVQRNEGVLARSWKYFYGGYVTIEEKPLATGDTVSERVYHYFDSKNRSAGTKDALGNRSRIFYDGQDHIVSQITPKGEVTSLVYDSQNNLLETHDPSPRSEVEFRTYDTQNRLKTIKDRKGKVTTYTYDSVYPYRVATVSRPFGSGQFVLDQFFYFPANSVNAGELQSVIDPALNATTFEYDTRGNLSKLTPPAIPGQPSGIVNMTYFKSGDLQATTDANGIRTEYLYNKRRQLKTKTVDRNTASNLNGQNVIYKMDYDDSGRVQSNTDPNNNITSYSYTADGRGTDTTLPGVTVFGGGAATPVVKTRYDERNYVKTVENPAQEQVLSQYDPAGRLKSVQDPLLRTTTFELNENGQRVSVQSPLNVTPAQKTITDYTSRGEVKSVTAPGPDGGPVSYNYDANGNLSSVQNRKGNSFQNTYYDDNRLMTVSLPSLKATTYTYNSRGLIETKVEPSTDLITLHYDERGRLKDKTDQGGLSTTTYGYDGNGNLLTVTEQTGGASGPTGTITRTYDSLNRLGSYIYTDSANPSRNYTLGYGYWPNGNLKTITYPDNKQVTYYYTSHNLLWKVVDWANRTTVYEYDIADRLKQVTRQYNNTKRLLTYDAAGQLTAIDEVGPNNVPIAIWRFSDIDGAGRIKSEFMAPMPAPYTEPSHTIHHDADNRIDSIKLGNGPAYVPTYDPDGNMLTGPSTANVTGGSYVYNARNWLLSYTASGSTTTYSYDPEGNRVAVKQGAQNPTTFVINTAGSLSQVLVRTKPDNTMTFYVYGAGLLYEVDQADNTQTYHYDSRGSTVALTSGAGAVVYRAEYSIYGKLTAQSGTASTPFLFNGKYGVMTDPNGLYHMRARYYNPYIKRFINADPSGQAGGLNFYAYADGNPISFIDPFGLAAVGENQPSSWVASGTKWLEQTIGRGAGNFAFLIHYIAPHETRSETYGPETRESQDMRNSPGADVMRDRFYAAGAITQPRLGYDSGRAWRETLLDPRSADWTSTAAQVGGFGRAQVVNNGDGTATFTIPNLAGTKSFFYHLVPDIPKSVSYYGPFAPIHQTFTWTEPIDTFRIRTPPAPGGN